MRFGPRAGRLLCGNRERLEVRSLVAESGVQAPGAAFAVHFAPDGRTVVTAHLHPDVIVTNVSDGSAAILRTEEAVGQAQVAPDGKQIALVSADLLRIVDLTTRATLTSWTSQRLTRQPEQFDYCRFDPSGRRLLICTLGRALLLWHRDTDRFVRLEGHTEGVWKWTTFLDDGKAVVTGDGRHTSVFDSDTGRLRWRLPESAASMRETGEASSGVSGAIRRLLRREVPEPAGSAPAGAVPEVAYPLSTGRGGLIAIRRAGELQVWDVLEERLVRVFPLDGIETRQSCCCDVSPDRLMLAAAWRGRFVIWSLSDGATLSERRLDVSDLAFSCDGRLVAAWERRMLHVLPVSGDDACAYPTGEEVGRHPGEWNPRSGRELAFGDWSGRLHVLEHVRRHDARGQPPASV
jgi:WD40 repeat protein